MKKTNSQRNTFMGLLSGILWGLDTVLIGVVLLQSPLKESAFLAPFISTFLHDTFSTIWIFIFNLFNKEAWAFLPHLKTKSGLFVVLASLLGGPVGMTGYLLAIQNMGASNTAIVSSMYPAFGAFFGYIFLKEKMKSHGFFGLALVILATILLGMTAPENPQHLLIGLLFASLTVLGWSLESVIISYGMKNDMTPEASLQIRQLVSALTYGCLIIPLLKGYPLVGETFKSPVVLLLLITALFGSASYMFYYRAIEKIGAVKAMSLNISYSGWAIFIGLFFGNPFSWWSVCLALLVIIGAIMTTDHPLDIFKKGNERGTI